MSAAHRFGSLDQARDYVFAGNATITLVSVRTGARYTYRVRLDEPDHPVFVSLLTGPKNESDYRYLGFIRRSEIAIFRGSVKSCASHEAPSFRAFEYFVRALALAKTIPAELEVWHEGRCGRCGRTLTVPDSIARGIGPECAKIEVDRAAVLA